MNDFIQKVHEIDPLTYCRCQAEVSVIGLIDEPEVIIKDHPGNREIFFTSKVSKPGQTKSMKY